MKRIVTLFLSLVLLLSCLCAPASALFDPSLFYEVQARSAYVVNTDTNIIVYDKDSSRQVPAGGLTKYMTIALLLTNYADQLDNTFQMPFAISDYVYNTNNADMRSNETFTYREAMYAMLTRNANEAAMGLAYTLSGGDLAGETLTFNLGTEEGAYDLENGAYKFDVELTQNRLYTVTVSGAGYRTARYTVAMTEDKTMNFWNNVMSNEITVVDDVKDTVNFLAGDIVKDGKINIYDLSAVVAYFGTENNQAEYSKFAKYDLNRDGKIDMMDISIVLTSWGK
mgnify:CR=1 FL=1